MDRGHFLLYPGIVMMFAAGFLYFCLHGIVADDYAGMVCYTSIVLIVIGARRKSMRLVNIAVIINLITFINDFVLVLTKFINTGGTSTDQGLLSLGIIIIVIDLGLFFFIIRTFFTMPFHDAKKEFHRKSTSIVFGLLGIRMLIFLITSYYTHLDLLLLLLAFLDVLLLLLAIFGAIFCIAAFPYDKKKRLERERETQARLISAILKMLEFWKANYREMTKAEMVREKICTIDKCGAMIRVLHEAVTLPEPIPRDIIRIAQDVIKAFEAPNLLGILRTFNRSVHFSKLVGKYLVVNNFFESFPYFILEETAEASSPTQPEPLAIDLQSIHEDHGTIGTSLDQVPNAKVEVAVPTDSETPLVQKEQVSTENSDALTGVVYICPECGTKYRLSQAKEMEQNEVNCFVCNTPIVLD
ncbi:MAG TPA: hypothetical protein VKM55_11045 [Candidatus Lokiarchaeia archaeon]|nr:hypothetical protein [Candidatus Lokiarchaeia archaeon]